MSFGIDQKTEAPAFEPAMGREEARRALARALAAAAIPSADLDARVLLCAALGIDHAGLVRDPDLPLGAKCGRVGAFALRRLRREPVSRIVGFKEFWGARFEIGSPVLDPRPDTETLIEAVLSHVAGESGRNWRILDLGVGSGAILGILLQCLPQAFGVGVDVSPKACAIAQRNLDALGVASRGAILCGDWTSALRGRFDLIVSNPPYIAAGAIGGLEPEVAVHDPRLALDGGDDGLDAYRAIIPALADLMEPGGLVAFEFGEGQGQAVEALLRGAGLAAFEVSRDLAGRERVIAARA
ncbi:peptide chain release factor N(5)-glutamine methyltransferase [Methylocapsa aurea]|uniref:peptide chain release factor N(5)-glutamine methyltransferase n=1 Tax=Methylocapsa aurea TaxID=663610 RepID=UPI000AAF116D|nr:peptide chain release factor N(5)-glutamine methyltransferase [Methylocapsa aurea]